MIPPSTIPAIKGRLPEHWLPKHIDANDPAFVVADMMEYLPRDRCFWFILLSQFSRETGRMWPQKHAYTIGGQMKIAFRFFACSTALVHGWHVGIKEWKQWLVLKEKQTHLPAYKNCRMWSHSRDESFNNEQIYRYALPLLTLPIRINLPCHRRKMKDPCLSLSRYFRSTGILPLWSPILLFLMACGAFSKSAERFGVWDIIKVIIIVSNLGL